jgi:hypothetical protein
MHEVIGAVLAQGPTPAQSVDGHHRGIDEQHPGEHHRSDELSGRRGHDVHGEHADRECVADREPPAAAHEE